MDDHSTPEHRISDIILLRIDKGDDGKSMCAQGLRTKIW